MTRREYIAEQLLNPDGEHYETIVGCIIACPYLASTDSYFCKESAGREECIKCKDAWLDRKVDV